MTRQNVQEPAVDGSSPVSSLQVIHSTIRFIMDVVRVEIIEHDTFTFHPGQDLVTDANPAVAGMAGDFQSARSSPATPDSVTYGACHCNIMPQ